MKKRVAIVLGTGVGPIGGVRRMTEFIYRTVQQSGRYEPDLISLAASANDEASVRLVEPKSWSKGVQVKKGHWRDIPYTHIGAILSELEFQRYRPRSPLTEHLRAYDLIQVVSGTPAAAFAVTSIDKPTCLFAATVSKRERVSRLRQMQLLRRVWLQLMTVIVTRMESHAARRMSHIFAESEYTQMLLLDIVPKSRVSLGPPGVDVDLFRPKSDYDRIGHVLSVGRFDDPRKNVRLLFEAYRDLRASLADIPRLVLVGRSPIREKDWALAKKLGIADFVDVYQGVSDEKLAELYRRASLFVLPSDEEGLGIVILEAMASGLPVVSTRCGGPETAVDEGETGYLTPVGDADALAQAMAGLLKDSMLRERMGQAGRLRAENRFSMETAGEAYLEKYDELLQ